MKDTLKYIDKLLQGSDVQWKTLGEVCEFQNGFAFQSNLFKEVGLPIVRITNVNGTNVDLTDVKYFNPADYNSGNPLNYFIEKGDVLIAMSGATTGKIGYYNFDEKAYLNQRVGKFIPNAEILNNRFLFHFLLTKSNFLYALAGGGAQPNLSSNMLKEKLLLPIPPLPIQTEIVRILDTFTELTAELTTELRARKKQYQFYRDKLLTFEDGEVEWKSLGEVAKIQRGASPRPIAKFITEDENGIPWIKIGDTSANVKYIEKTEQKITTEGAKKSRILKKGDFIMSNSMSFGRPYILNIDGAIHDGWASICDFEEKLNSDYLYHYLSSTIVQNYWISKINSGSVSNLNADIIKTLQIPIPPLHVQERIVSILDTFDTLTNSISEGLPKEIELRTKQYEYYRYLLLSFPRKD